MKAFLAPKSNTIRKAGRESVVPALSFKASSITGVDFGNLMAAPLGEQQTGAAGGGAEGGQDSSYAENNLLVPPNAQMGRSARQLEITSQLASPNLGGGAEPV